MTLFFISLSLLMILAIGLDTAKYIIPNWLVALVLLLYVPFVFMAPEMPDWPWALVALLAVFVVGYGMFMLNWMGGGDVKLLAACALWVGWSNTLLEYVVWVAVFGGLLSIALLALRMLIPYVLKNPNLPRVLTKGAPVPYGIGIALTFLILIWQERIPGLVY